MNNLTFGDLHTQLYRLYQKGEYEQALDLATRAASRFPTEGLRTYYWRICMASLINEAALALQFFEEALEAGLWYAEAQLREDPDLQPLQGLPQFERLVEVCRKRQAEAQAQAAPDLITLQPEGGCQAGLQACPLLLALHGNQRTAEVAVGFWRPAVSEGWLLALPQSSQVSGPDAYVWNDRDWAVREIQEHYATLCEHYAVDPDRVVVAGFSLGGELAIWLALSGTIEARGFISVGPAGPYMREPDKWISLIEASQGRGLRGYVVVGEQDVFSCEGTQALATLLKSRDIPCELEVHPNLGHDFPPEFQQSLSRALEFILRA
ncbi:MAG: alpha/beta hydrolase [Anaerolineae bacterium]